MANTKSTAITNLDASPVVANTSGNGAGARVKEVSQNVTVPSGVAANDTFQLVRLPSTVRIKQVLVSTNTLAATALTFDVNLNYSSATNDGTSPSKQNTQAKSQMFAAALDLHAAVTQKDITFSAMALGGENKQLWDAAGLSSDPGGYIDIVFKAITVTTVSAGGTLQVSVRYTD